MYEVHDFGRQRIKKMNEETWVGGGVELSYRVESSIQRWFGCTERIVEGRLVKTVMKKEVSLRRLRESVILGEWMS